MRTSAFEDKLRSAFDTYRLEDARLAGEVKLLLHAHRRLLWEKLGADGLDLSRRLAVVIDQLLTLYLERAEPGRGLALLALGGYGRGELNPYSDVDLLLLYPERAEGRAEDLAGPLLAFLWDLGLAVGHAARSPAECAEAMERDLPSATAMLEGRFVAGSKVLFRKYVKEVAEPWLSARSEEFIRKKIEEARARHRFYGGSVRTCSPHVKEGPGGLRDMHVSGWIGFAISGRKDFRVFREAGLLTETGSAELLRAYGWIHQVRNALHLDSAARQDVLFDAARRGVASRLGFTDGSALTAGEQLMRTFYRAAGTLNRFLSKVVRFQEGCDVEPARRRLEGGLLAVGDEVLPAGETAWTPAQALEAVTAVAESDLAPSPELVDAVERAAGEIDGRTRVDRSVAERFLRLLAAPAAGRALRCLDRAGFLAAYLPEFGAVAGLIRDDYVHQYTVDEHLLRAVESLDRLVAEKEEVRDEYARLVRPELLRLAILLHDIGKARGRGHVARGVAMIPDIARRLGIEEEDARLVRYLIEHHPLIPDLADRRPPTEGAVELAAVTPSRYHLRSLYLLALADVAAAGRGALSGWREAQIGKLFREALAILLPRPAAPYEERIVAEVGEARREAVREHLRGMGSRYALEVESSRAALHLDLAERLGDRKAALAHLGATGYGEVWVAARDAPGVFAKITGVLSLAGLDITAAQAYTRRDGVAVDGFFAVHKGVAPPDDPDFWRAVAEDLCRVLAGETDLAPRLEEHRRRFRPSPPAVPEGIALGATVSNRISPSFSVLEVTTLDRPALLHDLAAAVTGRGFSIHHAVVATRGGVVSDTFYLRRPDGGQPAVEELGPLLSDLEALLGENRRLPDGRISGSTSDLPPTRST